MADVQRTGGIGGDELDVRGPAPPRVAPAVPPAGGQHGREHARQLRLCQEEVDEAGPRDLHLFHVTGGEFERADELVGDGTRRLPQTLREEEREIRRSEERRVGKECSSRRSRECEREREVVNWYRG